MLRAEEECGKFVDRLTGRQEVLQKGTCQCLHVGFTNRSGAYVSQPSFGTLETSIRPSDDYWDFGKYEKSWGNILLEMETFTIQQSGKRFDFLVSGIQFCFCAVSLAVTKSQLQMRRLCMSHSTRRFIKSNCTHVTWTKWLGYWFHTSNVNRMFTGSHL